MSYTKLTDFASKDALLTGNPSKLVRGTELGAEFDAIVVADALNIKPDTVAAATSKTTPVDADLLPLFDSASTFSLKKLTWSNLKATIKTYFDTLYAESGANTSITSLGAVTGVTATAGDSTTKLATTAFVAGAALVPVGSIIDYAGTSAPTGYLACPVSATNISRTTYAALFTAIGTTWGIGDGSTTFGMPWFPANYSSVQANSNVGTSTAGQVIAHTHTAIFSAGPGGGSQYPIASASDNATASGPTTSTGGSANLAAGVRVLKCVKY